MRILFTHVRPMTRLFERLIIFFKSYMESFPLIIFSFKCFNFCLDLHASYLHQSLNIMKTLPNFGSDMVVGYFEKCSVDCARVFIVLKNVHITNIFDTLFITMFYVYGSSFFVNWIAKFLEPFLQTGNCQLLVKCYYLSVIIYFTS